MTHGQSDDDGGGATDLTDRHGILGAAIDLDELERIEPVYRYPETVA